MAGESARGVARRHRERSERLVRVAEAYEKGAEGEAVTAAILADLGPQWQRLDDVHWPGRRVANIDHVVVGPGGIFVIDAKNWSGNLEIGPDTIRQNGYRRQSSLDGVEAAARAVMTVLPGDAQIHVSPILCFVREAQIRGRIGEVYVASTTTLLARMRSMPAVLDQDQVHQLICSLRVSLPEAALPLPVVSRPPSTVSRLRTARRAATKTRTKPAGLLAELVALAVVIGIGLFVSTHAVDLFASPASTQRDEPAQLEKKVKPDGPTKHHRPDAQRSRQP